MNATLDYTQRRPAASLAPLWLCAALVIGFAVAVGLAAHVRIYLPFTPVPITLQTLVVLLAPLALGARLGSAAMGFYLLLGLTGWPVFTPTSWATFGYLIGFLAAQPVVAAICYPAPRTSVMLGRLALAMLAGNAVIFACGLSGLALWMGLVSQQAFDLNGLFVLGMLPFIPGMIVKSVAAAAIGWPLLLTLRKRVDPPRSTLIGRG